MEKRETNSTEAHLDQAPKDGVNGYLYNCAHSMTQFLPSHPLRPFVPPIDTEKPLGKNKIEEDFIYPGDSFFFLFFYLSSLSLSTHSNRILEETWEG